MGYFVFPPEYIPYVSTLINLIFSFTPLFSYGTTVLGIRKKESSQGFSIDICGTMLVASILRIFYYFNDPFELTLLRQCFIMIFIQIILLNYALKYRSEDAICFEKYKSHWEKVYDRFVNLNYERVTEIFETYDLYDNFNNLNFRNLIIGLVILTLNCIYLNSLLLLSCVIEFYNNIIRLFDYHYIRPFSYWQWKETSTFWKFLIGFVAVLSIVQFAFNGNEYLGLCFGTASFMIESSLPLPQILLFQRIKNVKNFRTILLLSWLGGDVTKISYLFFGTDNVGVIFKFAAFFQMSLNLVITYQFFYYKMYPSNGANELQMNHIPMSSRNSEQPSSSRAASVAINGVISSNLMNSSIIPQSQHYQNSSRGGKSENNIDQGYINNVDSDVEDENNDENNDENYGVNLAKSSDINKIINNKIQRNTSIELQDNEINEKERDDVRSRGSTLH